MLILATACDLGMVLISLITGLVGGLIGVPIAFKLMDWLDLW